MRSVELREKERQSLDDQDNILLQAMDEVAGYLDITTEDFMEILRHAKDKGFSEVEETRPEEKITIKATTGGFAASLSDYFHKMRGEAHHSTHTGLKEIAWSWLGAFAGILAVSYLHFQMLAQSDFVMIIGSFGASAVLIYGAIRSPLAQPRNLVGGHVLSAFVGVIVYMLFPDQLWLASALAVSIAIAFMQVTGTMHPPGGATALIAVIGSNKIHALGFLYVVVPVGLGALVMLVIALLINNLARDRRYPEYWW